MDEVLAKCRKSGLSLPHVATGASLLLLACSLAAIPSATAEMLRFLLAPTAALVRFATALQLSFVPGLGYLADDNSLLIAPECAGARFLVIAAVAGITAVQTAPTLLDELARLGRTLLLAYAITIWANASRIVVLLLADQALAAAQLQLLGWMHEVVGGCIYFSFLVAFTCLQRYRL